MRDGIPGVIDKTGAWVFKESEQQIPFAMTFRVHGDPNSATIRGWHFKKGDRWGFLFDMDADRIGAVHESGLLAFLREGKWGLVDTAGQVMVEPQFDSWTALCAVSPWPSAVSTGAP